MPVLTQGAVVSLSHVGYQDGQTVMLTHHWRVNYVTLPTIEANIAIGLLHEELNADDGLFDKYTNALSIDIGGIEPSYQVIYPVRFSRQPMETTFDQGILEGTAMPPNVSAAITLRSDFAGRGEVATKHIGALPVLAVNNGLIVDDHRGFYAEIAQKLIEVITVESDATEIEFIPVIYKRSAPNESPVLKGYSIPVTSRVMRRRTVGLGI